MDPGFLLVENFGRFVAVLGLLLATPAFAYAGWLWISSMGDPSRSAAARNSVISVCVGVVVIGLSFIVPLALSDYVVAPSGGVEYQMEGGINCDQILRDQLVANTEISNANRIAYAVQRIQSTFEGCNAALWNPVVRRDTAGVGSACFDNSSRNSVAGVEIPDSLFQRQWTGTGSGYSAASASGRDDRNNVIVHWTTATAGALYSMDWGLPSDGSACWLYISGISTWVEGYE